MRVRVTDEFPPLVPIASEVPHGSVLGSLLFLIFVICLPTSIMSKCNLFADDIKLICLSEDIDTLAEDLCKTWLWTETWVLGLNVNNCLRPHLDPGAHQKLTSKSLSMLKVFFLLEKSIKVSTSLVQPNPSINTLNFRSICFLILHFTPCSRHC